MYRHILVATDGSRLSDKALNAAIALAQQLGAKLTIFHATEDYPIMPSPDYAAGIGSFSPEAWKADQEKRAQRILAKAQTTAEKAGIACSTKSATALHPYEAIMEAAKKGRCDLIVMASHGRRGIQALVLGSETNKVLTHSKLAVLVVR
jgi:nucleotide-binding universal stress UspA family protein